jgi:hypothetical protein
VEKLLKAKVLLRRSTLDLIAACIVLAFSIFMLLYGVPVLILVGYGDNTFNLTPQTLPYLVSLLMLLFGAILLRRAFVGYSKKDIDEPLVEFYGISFAVLLLCLFFLLTLYPLGYPISNMIMIIGMYYLTGGKKLLHAVALSVIFTIISVLFFYTYLKLSIPMGPLEFLLY